MYCCKLWVGTVKKLFCPTVCCKVERGVAPVLQRLSRFTVKMSAVKKKFVGLELGVVIVKVSIELRVALIRMVEQTVLVFLGSSNWVTP